MKSPNIESLYASLDKSIKLAESYSEIDNLSFIIKACRLKPIDYIKNKSNNIILYRQWADEFGNTFNITKHKKIKIITGDLAAPHICTDIYYGLSILKISKMSKLLFIYAGKDDDNYDNCYLITFLGIDNFLRSYLYIYDEWRQISPLAIGITNLKNIVKKSDIKYYIKLKNKEKSILPCLTGQAWLTSLPASKEFTDIIRKEYPHILPLLTKDF